MGTWGSVGKVRRMQGAALHPNGAVFALLRAGLVPRSCKKSRPDFSPVAPLMLFILLRSASAHPQCLDFEPPFRPQWHLEFCTQYEHFGCCDQKTDNGIAERYWDIIDQLEAAGDEFCWDVLKEIMCQVHVGAFLQSVWMLIS